MKTIRKFLLVFGILTAAAIGSKAQIRVVVRRPVAPVFVRPAAPYPHAVWVPGEWAWRGREYVYVNPHYIRERRGHAWIPGHWDNVRGGSVWVAGRWR
jgi:hypothetical protein